MNDIKYHNAYDEDKNIVGIESMSRNFCKNHKFYCISCGAEMIAKLGEERAHHFAHKQENVSCSSETYLHKLAKLLLKKKFDESSLFLIKYESKTLCSKRNGCCFYKEDLCLSYERKAINLKEVYDTCLLEQPIGQYKADLLLFDSRGIHKSPLLLEIKVSHKCTKEKLSSGFRIVEIGIDSEEDIKTLCAGNKCVIEENDKNIFVGFKEERISSRDYLTHVSLYKSGAYYADWYRCCATKQNPYSVCEFLVDDTTPPCLSYSATEIVLTYAKMLGFPIRNCELCKYSRRDYILENGKMKCNLHNKLGTPSFPNQKDANDCSYYRIDKDIENAIKRSINIGGINIVRIK